jgi:hypothetical protein
MPVLPSPLLRRCVLHHAAMAEEPLWLRLCIKTVQTPCERTLVLPMGLQDDSEDCSLTIRTRVSRAVRRCGMASVQHVAVFGSPTTTTGKTEELRVFYSRDEAGVLRCRLVKAHHKAAREGRDDSYYQDLIERTMPSSYRSPWLPFFRFHVPIEGADGLEVLDVTVNHGPERCIVGKRPGGTSHDGTHIFSFWAHPLSTFVCRVARSFQIRASIRGNVVVPRDVHSVILQSRLEEAGHVPWEHVGHVAWQTRHRFLAFAKPVCGTTLFVVSERCGGEWYTRQKVSSHFVDESWEPTDVYFYAFDTPRPGLSRFVIERAKRFPEMYRVSNRMEASKEWEVAHVFYAFDAEDEWLEPPLEEGDSDSG